MAENRRWQTKEDLMPSPSKYEKTWQFPHDTGEVASQIHQHMEVRSEDFGAGSQRLGKVVVIGTIYGKMRIRIEEGADVEI